MDQQFQKRFHLPEDEIVLVRFPCHYKKSQGVMEASQSYCGYHGSEGGWWLVEIKDLKEIEKISADSLSFSTNEMRDVFSSIAQVDRIHALLKVLFEPNKTTHENTICDSSLVIHEGYLSQNPSLTDTVLSIPIDRLVSHYILSSHFYESLLLLGKDFNVKIGQWYEVKTKSCCEEMQRNVQSQHVYEVLRKQITCKISQHHSFVYHKPKNVATLTIHHTTNNLPLHESLTLIIYWLIEKVDSHSCRIRVSVKTEGKSGIVNTMMKSYVMKESQAVCRRWIKTIQEREVTKPILVLPKVENIIEKQSTLTKQLTMCIWLFMFALFMAYQYFKYHCLVCSKSVDAEISIYI